MSKKVVLLVEDNADDVDLTIYALKKSDAARHELQVVNDGVEALDYFFGSGSGPVVMPDMVLLDLKLPRINGLEVLKRLREEKMTRNLPVVILTSSKEDQDINTCYRLGANAYVRKPVDFTNFMTVINQIMSFWLTINVPCRRKDV